MKLIPINFAESLDGPGHRHPVLAAVGPDLRRLYGDPPPMPAKIAALLARLAEREPGPARS